MGGTDHLCAARPASGAFPFLMLQTGFPLEVPTSPDPALHIVGFPSLRSSIAFCRRITAGLLSRTALYFIETPAGHTFGPPRLTAKPFTFHRNAGNGARFNKLSAPASLSRIPQFGAYFALSHTQSTWNTLHSDWRLPVTGDFLAVTLGLRVIDRPEPVSSTTFD